MNVQKTLIGIIMAGLLASTAACGGSSDPAATITDAASTPTAASDQQVKDLEAQIADMQKQIDDLKNQNPSASPDAAANTLLTLDALVGKWKMTSYVVTNTSTGEHSDWIALGCQGEVVISDTSTIGLTMTDPKGTVFSENKIYALTIKDGKELIYQDTIIEATIKGDAMHWSLNGVEVELVRE